MKLLSVTDLAGLIKERHVQQVQQLLSNGIRPKLAIIQVKDDPVIDTYVRLKKQYGTDIGVEVELHKIAQRDVRQAINELNDNSSVNGIIIQLPLDDPSQTEDLVNLVSPGKDVDALGEKAQFKPATPMAILWLLEHYKINLRGKRVLLIGRGKLVGAPLEKILKEAKIPVTVAQRNTTDLKQLTHEAEIIITAADTPGIISSEMIKPNTVIVDAGVASEDGKTLGNVVPEIYTRDDITITPAKGGVGPLTVCALFENVIRVAQKIQ